MQLFKNMFTLFNFPKADIKSAHSLVYSKLFNALSTALTYLKHKSIISIKYFENNINYLLTIP